MKLKLYYKLKVAKWFLFLGYLLFAALTTSTGYYLFKSNFKEAGISIVFAALIIFSIIKANKNKDELKEQIVEVDKFEIV